jgi:hypothetical protein
LLGLHGTMSGLHVGSQLDVNSLLEEAGTDRLPDLLEERIWGSFAAMAGFVFLSPLLFVVSLVDLQPSGLPQGSSLEIVLETESRKENQRIASL